MFGRSSHPPVAWAVAAIFALASCHGDEPPAAATSQGNAAEPGKPAEPAGPTEEELAQKALDANFPLHGLITGAQLKVRREADPDAAVLGWLRMGSRVRLAANPRKTTTCSSGWYGLHPQGWACAGEGIEVDDKPVDTTVALNPPARDAALPYSYYFVKEPKVPEYHRLPSRDEQRAALGFLERYRKLHERDAERAERYVRGGLPNEPAPPKVVRGYLDRGFFIAGAGIEERAFRSFVRTVRGSYVKQAQLEERTGSSFHGVELTDGRTLPIAWAVRTAQPFHVKQRDDGSTKFVADEATEPYERLSVLPWKGRKRVGERLLHELEDGRFLKHWFVAVAEKVEPPPEVGKDEPWVHVSLEQQTLVLYQGAQPVYATLVSTGLEGHDTPEGLFQIHTKMVADTMADLGPDAGDDRYQIQDVPWTQYFKGSLALHGAFWHERFGLRRSHGCVNLAPLDAHRVFNHTWPVVAEGWHGVSADGAKHASHVLITQ